MNDRTYNGWTNYATWRINLEIVDDYIMNSLVLDHLTFSSTEELADHLSDYVDDVVSREGDGLAVDYARAFIADVDWFEIAETHAADTPELIETEEDDD